LYERNEFAHYLSDPDLKGLIVESTGLEPDGGTVRSILGSFKALKEFAKFDGESDAEPSPEDESATQEDTKTPNADTSQKQGLPPKLGISYTINLNLPPVSDIAVFNAIFKSLKEHLLR
jgi:hypothetical protein